MNKKCKILYVLVVSLLSSIWTTCFATNIMDLESENTEYIGNYEEYEQLVNEVTGSGYTQEDLKNYYKEYQEYIKEYYNSYEREETVKARVVSIEEIVEQYEYNDYYYSVSKYEIQPLVVEIIEGEHIGERFEIDYLLTGDSLNNIKYSKLQIGDVIFVSVMTDEKTDNNYADITNTGSNVERIGVVFCIVIVATLLLIVYGGKKGLLTALITLLVLDFCLVIIPNMGFAGQGVLIAGAILILLLTFLIAITRLGLNIKAVKASIISIIMSLITLVLIVCANYLTRTVGTTFEVAAISENVLLGNINFESLYIVITMIISSSVITNIVSKTILRLSKTDVEGFNKQIDECKDILVPNVINLVVTLFAMYIPNQLLLLTNKYTASEVWNSEILVSELIRLFVIIISMALSIPVTVVFNEKEKK